MSMPNETTATIEPTTIRPAGPTDALLIAGVLAHAFQEDPVFAWSIPDPISRRARLPGVFAAFAELYLPHDETYMTQDGTGTAIWSPAGIDPFAGEPGEVFGERIAQLLDHDDAERCREVGQIFEEHHPDEPCVYLQLIGVIPDRQGHGLGTQLLQPVLRRCDVEGIPAYLEASCVDNRRLYERHGFATIEDITLPSGGPTVWAMRREPVAA